MNTHSSPVVSEQSPVTKNVTKGGKLLAVLALSLGLTLAMMWLLGASLRVARAASFTVNTTDDELSSGDGKCSLREAIQAANTNTSVDGCTGSGDDTILLPAGIYTLTIGGRGDDSNLSGDLDITDTHALTISGAGPGLTTINANGIDRVLDVRWGAGTVVISGVTIYDGNLSAADGGGIRDADADLVLINTDVVSNSAQYGGGVYVNAGSVTLSGGQIASNTADSGGGVYVAQNTAAFTQTGVSTITLNTANYGGGMYIDLGGATLSGGQIVSNSADYGGGVYVNQGSATLGEGQIINNKAINGGGMYVNQGSATLSGGQIARNTVTVGIPPDGCGGGIYVNSGSATLSGGQIINNKASTGGGVCVSQSTGIFTQTGVSTITLNGAIVGGGVYIETGSATLNGGQVVSNTASSYGGGVYIRRGNAVLSGGQIVSNTAHEGGGVYVSSGNAMLSGGQIVRNIATDSGGGVYVYGSTAAFTQTGVNAISFNSADVDGGGVYVESGRATVSGGQVVNNTAAYRGGGVYVSASTAAFTQTGAGSISLNSAGVDGGGMYVESGRATVSGGQIAGNTAQVGGGLYNYSGTLTLVNSTVSGNAATASGGGLFSGGTSVLTFTTVASNTAGSGASGLHRTGGAILLQDTLIAYNGTNCNAALTSNGHNLEDTHSCGLGVSGDMADTDPLLGPLSTDDGTRVHPLRAGSPAIDHGVCLGDIATDQRGASRPQGFTCDIGAYEWGLLRRIYLPVTLKSG